MNTEQLQHIIQCDVYMKRCVLGVFPVDQIPPHLPLGTGVIVNTDPARLPGRHWVAFYLNQKNELECFDSFRKSPFTYSAYMKQFMARFSKTDINEKQLQSRDTNLCGQYCLFFLMCRCRGLSIDYFLHLFSNLQHINDELVYDIIKRDFGCCLYNCNHGKCSVSEKKTV